MRVDQLLNSKKPTVSFEFFPPKSEQAARDLFDSIARLSSLDPHFVSITYGAGGSTRDLTQTLVSKLCNETNLCIVPHLTTVCHTYSELDIIIQKHRENGVENIMALRGDFPKNYNPDDAPKDGPRYASDLVKMIKKIHPEICIGVAGYPEGHPQTPNRLKEMDYLKEKVDAGADYICTQLFFDNHDFYDFKERCLIAGINIPIVAGLMPVTSVKNLKRIVVLSAGSRVPAGLLAAINRGQSDADVEKIGIHWCTEQFRDLLDHNTAGVHFYTLNKSKATLQIIQNLGIHNCHQI